jgi:transposase
MGYASLFHDAGPARRVLFACPGRDAAVFEHFVAERSAARLRTRGGDPRAIEAVAMDLSKAYRAGAAQQLPNAQRCFDRSHVIQLANAALDEVRRAEVKTEPTLKGNRWARAKTPGAGAARRSSPCTG